jgi:hypothetical protein
MPGIAPTVMKTLAPAQVFAPPGIIRIPILISAIGNVVVATIWLSTCFLFFFAIPCVLLCVFEFRLYMKSDLLKPRDFVAQAQTLAIAEIVVGLVNMISLVCGIIILVNVPSIKRRYPAG